MRSFWIRTGHNPNDQCPYMKWQERHQRKKYHVTTEAEVGRMQLQKLTDGMGHQPPSEARRRWVRTAHSGRELGPATPWFWTSRFPNCKRIHFCCFTLPSSWDFVTGTPGSKYSQTKILLLADANALWVIFKVIVNLIWKLVPIIEFLIFGIR